MVPRVCEVDTVEYCARFHRFSSVNFSMATVVLCSDHAKLSCCSSVYYFSELSGLIVKLTSEVQDQEWVVFWPSESKTTVLFMGLGISELRTVIRSRWPAKFAVHLRIFHRSLFSFTLD